MESSEPQIILHITEVRTLRYSAITLFLSLILDPNIILYILSYNLELIITCTFFNLGNFLVVLSNLNII